MTKQSKKNINNLPIIRCTSLYRLVKLVKEAQKGGIVEDIIYDPKTGKQHKNIKLTDLLGVDLAEDKETITVIFAKLPFYWEVWDLGNSSNQDQLQGISVKYKFDIDFGKMPTLEASIEIGDVINTRNKFINFLGELNFDSVKFSGVIKFQDVIFSERVNFEYAKFLSKEEISFMRVTFSRKTKFFHAEFSGIANFWYATFSEEADFGYISFSNVANFWHATFSREASFESAIFQEAVMLTKISFKNENNKHHFIDLSDSTIKNKAIFDLDESKERYNQITLCLHNSNITYFACDDKELEQINLYWDKPIREADKSIDEKTKIEKHLHELRIMRRILQNMNWGDASDRYYAQIMDNQLELTKTKSKIIYWFEKFVFKTCFGWGVRIRNVGFTVLFSILIPFLVTFIAWSFFAKSISVANLLTTLEFTVRAFLTLDVTVMPDMPNWFLPIGLTESTLGLLIYTLFVAILARKFMRL
jgi:uncharacterized protein YjbI with pentapeptide repeats